MLIPDYINPLVGYRAWLWRNKRSVSALSDTANVWIPTIAYEAICEFPGDTDHDAPDFNCDCGLYAVKDKADLKATEYFEQGDIHGEVYLWGKLIEHERGWRAQYAYPKSFVIPAYILSYENRARDAQRNLKNLLPFGCDIFLTDDEDTQQVPYFLKEKGIQNEGIKFIEEYERIQWNLEHSPA